MTVGVAQPSLLTADAVTLAARIRKADGTPRAAVVVAHGLGAHSEEPSVVETVEALHARGLDVVTYDARGHGRSEGASTLGDLEALDVAAAVCLAGQRTDRVVVVGASMGAIAALRYAATAPTLAGVVTVSSPARWVLPRNPRAMAAALVTRTPFGRAIAARAMKIRIASAWTDPAPPVELVEQIEAPIAIVHGRADSFIPVSAAHELFARSGEPRRLHLTSGMGHAFGRSAIAPVCDAVEWCLARAGGDR
jgi:alpha-beta hydrolase superfamily lysophospholipase